MSKGVKIPPALASVTAALALALLCAALGLVRFASGEQVRAPAASAPAPAIDANGNWAERRR